MTLIPYGDEARAQLDFIHHCINGNFDEVRSFLSNYRAYPHYAHPYNGWTALHFAANCGHARIVKELVEAGFEPQAEGYCKEVPYDVADCENDEDLSALLSLLHFDGNFDYRKEMPGEAADTASSSLSSASSRRGSMSSEGYTPPFTSRPPPFPEAKTRKPLPISASRSTSFDFASGPGTPVVTPSSPSYSYGRRDSLYRTRFLLVRTAHGGGKEAYTRVTLPGGSGVEQLKRTIEKAMKGRRVDAVFTLPDSTMVEFDEQICLFANSQRVDVLFNDGELTPEPIGDAVPTATARKASCPDVPASTSYSTHPSLSREQVSMDVPTTIREGSPAAENGGDFLKSVLDDSIKDASLVEIPSETKEQPEEIDYSIVDKREEEEEEEVKVEEQKEVEEVKEEIDEEKEEEKEEEEVPKEPTPTPVTPASPTLRTIPVQKSEEEEEEEEEEEIIEKQRPLVIRKTTSSEEKREEKDEEQPQKVESVRSDSVGGFEEVSRDDVVDATKEDAEEMVKEEPKKKEEEKSVEPSSTTNGHSATTVVPKTATTSIPKVTLTKADSSSSSSIVDYFNAHPELVKHLLAVGVLGAVAGVGFVVVRKYR